MTEHIKQLLELWLLSVSAFTIYRIGKAARAFEYFLRQRIHADKKEK